MKAGKKIEKEKSLKVSLEYYNYLLAIQKRFVKFDNREPPTLRWINDEQMRRGKAVRLFNIIEESREK